MKNKSNKNRADKNKFIAQLIILIIISGSLSGMLIGTDVYKEVKNNIVEVLCLSCLKLDPKTTVEFTFEPADDAKHPDYVLDNLSLGIVVLHFSEDACPGCDIMYPVMKDLLSVDFGKQELFSKNLKYNDHKIAYFYTNIDHATDSRITPFETYDIRDINGLPMFVVITLGYDKGIVKPKFSTFYGTLGLKTDGKRIELLESVLDDAFILWEENAAGYDS